MSRQAEPAAEAPARAQPTGRLPGTGMGRRSFLGLGVLGLAACSRVPVSGPVEQVSPSAQAPLEGGVVVRPIPPLAGAGPDVVMAGFLDAMASLEPGFVVARDYLTARAARAWDPLAGVTVFDGDSRSTLGGSSGAVLQARLMGRLDTLGHYTPATSEVLTHDFRMRRVDGQWRIDNPPTGLLVSQYTLQHRFTAVPVWFLGSGERCVVPETVWLASSPATPTQAVQALLRGPSAWLAPAVATAIPAAMTHQTPAVTVDAHQARIGLGDELLALPDAQRRRVAAQIGWTLRSFPEVTSFRVLAGSQAWLFPGSEGDGSVALDDLMDLAPVGATEGAGPLAVVRQQVGTLDAQGSFQALPGRVGRHAWGVAPGALAAGPGGVLAVVDAGATSLYTCAAPAAEPVRRLVGRSLGRPQITASEQLWTSNGTDASTALTVLGASGAPRVLRIAELAGATLRRFSVSPDESLVAVLLQRGGASELGLLRLHAGGADGYRRLPLVVSQVVLEHVVDVGWTAPGQLMVLASAQPSVRASAYLVSADGAQVVEMGPAGNTDFTQLATDPQLQGVRALLRSSGGDVYSAESAWHWTRMASRVDAVTFPG